MKQQAHMRDGKNKYVLQETEPAVKSGTISWAEHKNYISLWPSRAASLAFQTTVYHQTLGLK